MKRYKWDEGDYGDLIEEELEKFNQMLDEGQTLSGDDAAVYLADLFAYETKGCFFASTLYHKADITKKYNITLSRLRTEWEEQ